MNRRPAEAVANLGAARWPVRLRAWLILALSCLTAIAACGATQAPAAAPKTNEPPASPMDRLLSLSDGKIWAYDAEEEGTGVKGMFVTRARKLVGTRFSLTTGDRAHIVETRADGVAYADGNSYLLKAPLSAGTEWQGERGSLVRISAVGKVATVPAGTFAGCVETVEELRGPGQAPLRRVTTLFCPDVGITSLYVEAWDEGKHIAERAMLRSFGQPVSIAP